MSGSRTKAENTKMSLEHLSMPDSKPVFKKTNPELHHNTSKGHRSGRSGPNNVCTYE
jgi:hypothetical protein